MAETILLEKVDVQEKIIYLDIKRIGEDGKAYPQKAKAFKSAEPYLKAGEKIQAVVEHQPADGKFPESWLVKPEADKKPARGGMKPAHNDASIAAQVILKEVATTCRLNDKLKPDDIAEAYTKVYTDAYAKLKAVHG